MKYMKKIHILLVAILLSVTLIGCEETPEVPTCDKGQVLVDNVCTDSEEEPVLDTTAPVITGVMDVIYTIGDSAPDYIAGLGATDDTDGELLDQVIVDSTLVDLTTEGTYVVTLTVSDAAGNTTTESYNVVVSERTLTDEEEGLLDLALIDLTTEFKLKTFYPNGSRVTWTSSDSRVISPGGYMNRPAIGEDDVTVTLTATLSNGDYTATKTFDILVEAREESTVSSFVELDFEGTSEEYVVENKEDIKIFFVDEGTVPYIDVETFINMLDGAIDASMLEYVVVGNILTLSYTVEWEDFDGTMIEQTLSAVIDFDNNTFAIDTYDFFGNYVSDTESDYGEGLTYVGADYVDSQPVVIPLGEYTFDLVIHNDGVSDYYLLPFHVANLLFAGNIYYDAYYNGEMIYGVDTFGLSSTSAADEVIHENMRTSIYNDEDMEFDMKEASFHFMALGFDYFYGLKMDQQVDSYYDFLYEYVDTYIMKYDSSLYKSVFEIANDLNDSHSWHVYAGYYTDIEYTEENLVVTKVSQFGPRVVEYYNKRWYVEGKYEDKYGSIDAIPFVELIDDEKIAVIHIQGFTIDTPDAFRLALNDLPETVESVVIDLGLNGGGNLGAVLRIFGYMTEETFAYHSQNPADGSAVTYYIESDYVAYDYNWYIIASPVTFSAANLMTSMAIENGIATVIGQKSSGGASSIGVLSTPDGSIIFMSTNNVLSTRTGNEIDGYEYISIEFGVEVEYELESITSDEEIIETIHMIEAQEN